MEQCGRIDAAILEQQAISSEASQDRALPAHTLHRPRYSGQWQPELAADMGCSRLASTPLSVALEEAMP
jgi:hypothetical protein